VRVPLSWLRDFAPFEDDPRQIAQTLDELGLVVEELVRVGEGLSDVVVARVVEIGAIPDAQKIRRVVVDAGAPDPVQVVCGAWNFSEGALVALAGPGTVLPGGVEIARRKMKGVVSNGMLCSGSELGLSDDHEGILVLGEGREGREGRESNPSAGSDGPFAPGTPLDEALGIEPDVVFDLAVDANRPDAASMAGVARDLAAKLKLPFDVPEPMVTESSAIEQARELVTVDVVDRDLCPRFTARVLDCVRVRPSPNDIARRLLLAGMRPINNVVDASNYVMLELGQPTHPYDFRRVDGGGLRVRAARPGEKVVTLDGVERTLATRSIGRGDDLRDCLICDAHDVPIGIGGVMGGTTSEIGASTSKVLLEAAYFAPMAIARTSKRLGVRTEASSRFERGVDPNGIDRAALRLCELVARSAGEEMELAPGVVDLEGDVPKPRRVHVRTGKVNALLGTELSDSDVCGYLKPIGFGCEVESPGALGVTVPTFRPDSEREVDIVEEVARHHGYERLPRLRVFPPQVGRLTRYQHERRFVREVLAGVGADEAWTPSLLAPEDHERAGLSGPGWSAMTLSNPLTPEESVLRRSLLPGMLKALAFNATRRAASIRLFEIGHVFPVPDTERVARVMKHEDPLATVVDEREMLGVLFADDDDDAATAVRAWRTIAEALGVVTVGLVARDDVPGMHPTRTAGLVIDEPGRAPDQGDGGGYGGDGGDGRAGVAELAAHSTIGFVGEVDPEVLEAFEVGGRRAGWLELDLGLLLGAVPRRPQLASPVSRFPSNDIDLAFVVDESKPAGDVTATLVAVGGEVLESIDLFDVYRGPGLPPGSRSVTWRLRFSALDHTLTDAEVGELRARCIEAVEREHGAQLRG
jgi:phenylalanyl-tRNA synthetase beta chain